MVFNNSKCLISIQNSFMTTLNYVFNSYFLNNGQWKIHTSFFPLNEGGPNEALQNEKKNILLSKLKSSRVIIILVKYGRESFVWIVFCKSCWFFCVHLMWHSCTFNDEEESKNHQPRAGNFLSLPPNAKKTFLTTLLVVTWTTTEQFWWVLKKSPPTHLRQRLSKAYFAFLSMFV